MTTGTGTLEEGQVRAMFDRIAGVYDPMNRVMTAGLDRRWRSRAADLADVGPGDRVLDVATGTGDLAMELASRVAPGGEVVGTDFSEEMLSRARAKEGDAAVRSNGPTRWPFPTSRPPSPRRRSASGRATSPTWAGGWPRWRGSCARAAASSSSRSPPPSARRCPGSTACGSTGGAGARPSRRRQRRLLLPARLGPPLPRPARTGRADGRLRAAGLRWILTAGGIIALHAGTVPG